MKLFLNARHCRRGLEMLGEGSSKYMCRIKGRSSDCLIARLNRVFSGLDWPPRLSNGMRLAGWQRQRHSGRRG